MLKRVGALLLAWVLVCIMSSSVFAQEAVNLRKQGSIEITMQKDGTAIPGGIMNLYQVAKVQQDGTDYSFKLTGAFTAYGKEMENIESAELAQELANYAQNSAGRKKAIDENGVVKFTELPCGLYLLIQETAASGYEKAVPFLVSVPMKEDGAYVYDVDASPKVELEQAEDETEPETKPSQITGGGGGSLPQTGQLNWPVPLLAVSGLMLFLVGWILRFGQRKESYEK